MSTMPVDSLEPRKIPDISPEILVLSANELTRLQNASRKQEKSKPQGREHIKESSKKMTSTWKNTITGITKERLRHVKEQQDIIEAERQKMDELEGAYQELRRRYVLDVAQSRRYEEQDRVRRLLGAKRFAESLKGRDEQKSTQNEVRHVFDEYNNAFDRAILADVDKYNEEIKEKAEKTRLANKSQVGHLNYQMKVSLEKENQEKYEDHQTTLMLQDLADKYRDDDNKQAQLDYQKKLNFFFQLKEEEASKEKLAKVLAKMDEAENERIKLFDEAKLKMKKMFIEKQKEFRRQKEAKKEEIASKLKDSSLHLRRKEEKNFKKAFREKEEEQNRADEEKRAERMKKIEEIEDFTKQSKINKDQAKQDYKVMRLNEGIQLKELYDKLTDEELSKLTARNQARKQAAHILLHQIEKKHNERSEKKQEELDDYARHMKGLYEEEETFQKFAKQLIEDCDAQGLDTHDLEAAALPGIECGKGPLRVERGCIRPKYLSAVTDPDELHYVSPMKAKATFEETKLRLGFCS